MGILYDCLYVSNKKHFFVQSFPESVILVELYKPYSILIALDLTHNLPKVFICQELNGIMYLLGEFTSVFTPSSIVFYEAILSIFKG